MQLPRALASEAMTINHFRLIWRHFGTTPTLRAAILAGTGISEVMLGTATTVTIGKQLQQLANMNALFSPGWFLEAREQLHFSAHGANTVAAMSAPTLHEALLVLTTFVEVRMPLIRARLATVGDTALLKIEPTGDFGLPDEIMRPIMLTVLISARSLVGSILADPAPRVQLNVRGPAPCYAAALAEAAGGLVSYDAPADSIGFPAAWLDSPSVLADAALYADAIANLNAAASARTRPPRTLRYRVEQLLAAQPDGRTGADACARALGLSRRTMTRRLADEGTGFRQLLEEDLRRRAGAMLEDGALSNARIAEALGYQNPTSFHRAMQRWGRPPA